MTPSRRTSRAALGATTSPAPTSFSADACSYTVTGRPARCRNAAAATPPMPAPTTATPGSADEGTAPVTARPTTSVLMSRVPS